ncbi:hypothetical protein BJV78DRAFT_1155494 [Lactifluus subvellereus]|nr:hypothetical protein BJV78DRAFT_1155494 [Lactifluus subvellereus]
MSHDHDHGYNCGDHAHGHGRDNVIALNSTGEGKEIIKPWNERLDERVYIESDANDQLSQIDNLEFSDAQDKEPLQQFDVAVGREVGEHPLNFAERRDDPDLLRRIPWPMK